MKSFKNIAVISALLLSLAHSERLSAFDADYWKQTAQAARSGASYAWQSYIKPACSWTLSSRPVKGIGALVSAGAASAAVGTAIGAAGAGLSYAVTRHGGLSRCAGAGIGALTALWFLNEFGGITARAAYAKMNGQTLSERYANEKKELEKLISGTLGLITKLKKSLEEIKLENPKTDSNNDAREAWVTAKTAAENILETFIRIENKSVDEHAPFIASKKLLRSRVWNEGLFSGELSYFEKASLEDKEQDQGVGLLDGTKTLSIQCELKQKIDSFILAAKALKKSIGQMSEGACTESPQDLVKAAQAIVDISSRHIQELSAAYWRVDWALYIAQKLGL